MKKSCQQHLLDAFIGDTLLVEATRVRAGEEEAGEGEEEDTDACSVDDKSVCELSLVSSSFNPVFFNCTLNPSGLLLLLSLLLSSSS